MIGGDHNRLWQLFVSLARAFRETRPEILLSFLLILALLLTFALVAKTQKRRAHRDLARHSRDILEHLLGRLDLDTQERALLGGLARHLARGASAHDLLVDPHVFDACVRAMGRSESVAEAQLVSLRLKMGFSVMQPEEVPVSSSDLPEGSPLLLLAGKSAKLRGTIISQGPGAMLVRLDSAFPALATDARVTAYFHNSAGVFAFFTRILARGEDSVRLEHSSHIRRYQRRKYYRKKEFLRVLVKSTSIAALPQESYLLDLGGGGASLRNPRRPFGIGELVEVALAPEIGKFKLSARVLRISRNGWVVNVEFESPSEMERNRIMGYLSRQSELRGVHSESF